MEAPVTTPASHRRTRLYCVGTAKSGTSSIGACLRNGVRSAHEPESEQTIDAILAVSNGDMSRKALREFLIERDQRLGLEVDSSQLNYFVLDELIALFPDALFILTIRDPYSWLDSFINHQLGRAASRRWVHLRELRFRARALTHPTEEDALKRRGLYTLDGYLSYWATHNQTVFSSVPREKLLAIRTDELSRRVGDIARFAGLDGNTVDTKRTHSNMADVRFNVLSELDSEYLHAKVQEHCGALLGQYFPEINLRG